MMKKRFLPLEKKLRALAEERFNKITTLMHEEYAKREQESKAYRAFVAGKKGETVAFIPTTSRVNPDSNYFTGYSNQGGQYERATAGYKTPGRAGESEEIGRGIAPKRAPASCLLQAPDVYAFGDS